MSRKSVVSVRFCHPPPHLRRYFTTFYLVEIDSPDGQPIEDYLHPEWANLRFVSGDLPSAYGVNGQNVENVQVCVSGPSSHTVRFQAGPKSRTWGVGLLPLGWARYVAAPACEYADAILDGTTNPLFAPFAALGAELFGRRPNFPAELAWITTFFESLGEHALPDEGRILAIHSALVDPDVHTVTDLVARAGLGQRTVERLCDRAFGFPPKRLLRRQRFLRSLAQYVLDPSLKWIGALDGHYHDQAQFVRDFKEFMGMSPRQYGALPKPILGGIMLERARFAGHAMQALDTPEGGAAFAVEPGQSTH